MNLTDALRNAFLLLLIPLFLFTSCSKKADGCLDDIISTGFKEDRTIEEVVGKDSTIYYQIVEGTNVVFQYDIAFAECEWILDDEYGETVTFELRKDQNKIDLHDSELSSITMVYNEWGAWANSRKVPVQKGRLTGEKVKSNVWLIDFEIEADAINTDEAKMVSFTGFVHLVR